MTMCSCSRSREFYRFPAMAKLGERTLEQQMAKVREEVAEAEEACGLVARVSPYTAPEDVLVRIIGFGMELMDVIHAAETALRMSFTPDEVKEFREAVIERNRKRGYYDETVA